MGTTRGFIRSCHSLSQWPSQNAQDIAKSREWTTDQLKAKLKIPDLLFNAWIEGDAHWRINGEGNSACAEQVGGRADCKLNQGEGDVAQLSGRNKDSVAFQDGGRENAEEKGGEGLAALENSLELMESEVCHSSFCIVYIFR